jgi:putative DNA primase/helicase
MPCVLGWYADGDEYRLDGSLSDAPEWLIEMITPPAPRPRKGKVGASADGDGHANGRIGPEELFGARDHFVAIEPRLSLVDWEVKELDDRDPILIGHCPGHDGTDKDLHIGIGDGGPYIRCKHEKCTLIPPLNGRPDGASEAVLEMAEEAIAQAVEVEQPSGDSDDGPADPLDRDAPVHTTDLGNARRMAKMYGGRMRYCGPWKSWFVWDGTRWRRDDTGEACRMAKRTIRAMQMEALGIEKKSRKAALLKWALESESARHIDAMIALCRSEPGVPVGVDRWDRDGWLFNCRNGTIDLRTGEPRNHDPDDFITKLCPLAYDPAAICPNWDRTLDLFFGGDRALVDYFQEVCGYAMVGEVRDHILPVCFGTGKNGKSTILEALMATFGRDYAMKCPPDMLMAKANDSHPTDRADLFGKRLVVAIETEEGRRLNETLVKELTGGDRIRARRMREDFWEFQPTHTVIMATNHKPVSRGTDRGIWRRIRLIPFLVAVEGEAEDKGMPRKLRAERAGILAWCVRGALRWQEHGLAEPKAVSDATGKYRWEQDVLGAFLAEHTVRGPRYKVQCGVLYAAYKKWAEDNGEYQKSLTAFGMAMQERGIETMKSSVKWYMGIGLRPAAPK